MLEERLNFTLGSDPEFFFCDPESGNMVSAIPHIIGTKEEPAPLPKGGNVQRDNVAVEIGTDVVLATGEWDWIDSLHNALEGLKTVTPKGLELAVVPSAFFPAGELLHEEAMRFGCDPDFDAWAVAQNDPPMATDTTFRSCGGHVHVGGIDLATGEPLKDTGFLVDFQGKLDTVRAMDVIHGTLFTILDSDDAAVKRRELYGKAGCHRPTEYGVEYRSLSNFWMRSPFTAKLIQELTNDALRVVKDGGLKTLIKDIGESRIQETINTGNVDNATRIMESFLWPRMGEQSRFFFNRSLAKLKENDLHFNKEWTTWAAERNKMFV